MNPSISRLVLPCAAAAVLAAGCGVEEEPERVSRTLPNGARVLVRENRASNVVSVQTWVADGALYETPDEAGEAYLLSQMLFTQTRGQSPGEFVKAVERLGGSMSVNPRHDFTQYAAIAPSENFEALLELVADGLENAVFDSAGFEDARRKTLSSIESIGRRPMERAHLLCISSLLEGHPYGRPVQGTVESVSTTELSDLRERYGRVYTGPNILFSVAGDVDPAWAADEIEKRMSDLPYGDPASPAAPPVDWPDDKTRIVRKADVRTGYQVMCFPAPSILDEDSITMDVLLMVLSGGRSSRFERVLSEERHLVTAVEAGWYTLRQPSPLFVWMELPPDNIEEAERTVASLFMDLVESEVSVEEIAKARTYWKTQVYFMNETAEGQAFYNAYWTFLGWPELPKEYLESIDDVTPEDVRRAAAKYFGSGAYSVAVLLPQWAQG
ncbi:MAG: hypothetical protein GF400_03470 [Candidatus Eisenbacteria bacterium]|nr:hypothetical protein [Candidatus Eisenbacteria bacterium]